MQYSLYSFRGGAKAVSSAALREICDALDAIDIDDVHRQRNELQAVEDKRAALAKTRPQKVGIQKIMNRLIRERLSGSPHNWTPEVALFEEDEESGKGLWTMDFRKEFGPDDRVGMEITFNHAEALAWTPVRLDLAHEAENVKEDAKLDAGVIVIGKDSMKKSKVQALREGKPAFRKNGQPIMRTESRMDGAVGTLERLLTVLPKMRNYVKIPLIVIGLDWANGAGDRSPINIDMTISKASLHKGKPT